MKYPVYVISKGRWERPLTARALIRMGIPFHLVVEPQEADAYAEAVGEEYVQALPFSDLGQGSIPARNWCWDHALAGGHDRHWIMDDNIVRFYRFNRNQKIAFADPTPFRIMEQFVDRYTNVAMAGPNYEHFASRREANQAPFIPNTRIYSCILLDNHLTHRWRGRYNEDTDLSLRVLKDGKVTILFNAFLANKVATMTMAGGNTDELYHQDEEFDGRLEMARSLLAQHPDCVRVVKKWGRWQHQVDYGRFKDNALIRRADLEVTQGVDEHGLELVPTASRRGT